IEQDENLKNNVEFKEKIEKIFKVFGEDEAIGAIEREYIETTKLEQEYTNLRWGTYTTLCAISFAIAGYVLSTLNSLHIIVKIITLFFAWFVHFFATFFYWWMHKISHSLRDYLKQLESILGFYKYTLRSKRPVPALKIFKKQIQFKFHWVVYAITILYLIGVILFAIRFQSLIER
ncbi:MAG: hypothetical protein AB1630_03535, partial [bacterium]